MAVKYVFVTGGVVSGLGKGITAASLGRLLKARGYHVTSQKFDPYINIDPGTMNPIQHGEVFVTDDGAETDLDLGHYERFIDEGLNKKSNVTTGKVYWSILSKERRGDYGGNTVQVIPHVTNEIKSRFYRSEDPSDQEVAIIEIGGTVGDIESQPFLEALRQFQHEVGHENCILIHVTLIPYLKSSGELKTKPTQASVKDLQGMGIQPDILVCRSDYPLDDGIKRKIAQFCNVERSRVIQNLDAEVLYEVPLMMEKEHLAHEVCECLNMPCPDPDLDDWKKMIDAWKHPEHKVEIALVGKYVSLHDAYISVVEALKQIKVPVLRWPGGCFADEYHWKDGIGPKETRKKMINTHWGGVVEDNSFGTHEFFELCEQLGCKAYVNGNLGSGTVQEMSEWVEYITFEGVSPMADLRKKNGHEKPWKLDFFGVGNENWGCGGNMNPDFYANEYRRYQTYVRNYHPDHPVSKICCGANVDDYEWTSEVLKTTHNHCLKELHGNMDGLSLHYYVHPEG